MNLIRRNTCRVCHSQSVKPVIDLGEQYIQGLFIKNEMPFPPQRKIPMSLIHCDPAQDENACGLLQTSYTVQPEILYSTYWYRSGVNATMRNHLKNIVHNALTVVKKKRSTVLDIGCNDGTLLNYYPSTFRKIGIDPSNAIETISQDIKVIHDLFPSPKLSATIDKGKFDIITSIAMYYDVDDPISFAQEIKKLLTENGIWIFEVFYLPHMLERNSYDTICHEHLSYFSLAVIEYILSKADLKLIKITENGINGGSICCFVTHKNNQLYEDASLSAIVQQLRSREFELKLDTELPYREFQKHIEQQKEQLTKMLKDLKRDGKHIHAYGASTKGNTILQFCGIDNTLIDVAADRNPEKWGALTLGTNIPIVSEEQSRALKPDYYLVLPWSFKQEFLKREARMLKDGTKMIFPLPNIEVISV